MSRHRRARSIGRLLLAISGVILLASGATLLWSMHAYRHRAHALANQLLRAETAQRVAATTGHEGGCDAPPPSDPRAGAVRAVLDIPALGLRAPVLAGTTDAQLDSGIGHLSSSSWPDQAGVVVLEAHDVTFFTALDKLTAGDVATLTSPCRSWIYRVVSGGVVPKGAAVSQRGPALVLVTCWPTNALYYTSRRYVVTATLQAASASSPIPPATSQAPALTAALPGALASADLSLDRVHLPVGLLAEDPALSDSIRQSAAAYTDIRAVEQLFVAALVTAQQQQTGWWAALATHVPYADLGPLRGSLPAHWQSPVDIQLDGSGQVVSGASASGAAWLASSGALRLYRITMTASVSRDRLYIAGWSVVPLHHA